eukprot:s890_g12.t1
MAETLAGKGVAGARSPACLQPSKSKPFRYALSLIQSNKKHLTSLTDSVRGAVDLQKVTHGSSCWIAKSALPGLMVRTPRRLASRATLPRCFSSTSVQLQKYLAALSRQEAFAFA